MKILLIESKMKEICVQNGLIFVNRSFGQMTTGPVSLITLFQIIEKAILENENIKEKRAKNYGNT